MNPLAKHYDSNLSAITLHGITFHVKLPTMDNKRFQRAVMSKVAKRDDEGSFTASDTTLEEMANAQLEAFVYHCIRKVDGWDDFTPESLLNETPDAADELFQLAADLAEAAQAEAEEAVGKSQAGLSGPSDGAKSETSTPSLKSAAG